MASIFDRMTAKPDDPASDEQGTEAEAPSAAQDHASPAAGASGYTARILKTAAQELLKSGLLDADRKPNLYQTAISQTQAINQILEPFDLRLQVDDVRGLAFLAVAQPVFGGDDDEWTHPLVRRQRLNLEQSLMVAILRQHFVAHEQEAGLGASEARVELDELLPQLQLYLGETGSDVREQKRLRNLLENLKNHGIVSEVDAQDQVTIRPIITHLANPENLKNLLQHFRQQASGEPYEREAETPADNPADKPGDAE